VTIMSVSSVAPRVVIKRREQITALPLYYYGDLQMKREGEQVTEAIPQNTARPPAARYTGCVLLNTCSNHGVSDFAFLRKRKCVKYSKKGPASFQLEIPQDLQLLPGQMVRIQDVLEQEIQRINASHASEYRDPLSFPQTIPDEAYEDVVIQMPPCFSTVSREEAEMMLEDHPEYGSIILRPATDGINYAVTIRQLFDRNSVIKHYRVRSQDRSFVIELNSPVTVSNLYDVVQYFLTETSHRLKPFVQTSTKPCTAGRSQRPVCRGGHVRSRK
uniref:SH2 domain-containing protein n=1 Tax=Paramormyrops kingsleyae TaxID=1676925 RepID=A0A3B3SVW9_9TELE